MTHAARLATLVAASVTACSPRPAAHREEPARAVAGEPVNPPPGVVGVEAAQALARAGARIVDVRTPEEFAGGHVAGAVNVPFDQIGSRAAELGPPDTAIVLYCRTGRRSALAAEALRALGYGRVWDAQRYDAWAGAGGR